MAVSDSEDDEDDECDDDHNNVVNMLNSYKPPFKKIYTSKSANVLMNDASHIKSLLSLRKESGFFTEVVERALGVREPLNATVMIEVERETYDTPEPCLLCGSTTGCMCPRPKKKVEVLKRKTHIDEPINKIMRDLRVVRGMAFMYGDMETYDALEPVLRRLHERREDTDTLPELK
jgi:hypothetical protein